ncbi:MAG: SEL1-like repeat protein [Holophaga sp.]|jgi:TPR repeat protein
MPAEAPDPVNRGLDTQPIPVPADRPRSAPGRRRALRYWMGGIVAVLILAGAAASYWRVRPAPPPGEPEPVTAAKDIPPTLRPYYDRALTGDASAMRMLGTMYYNGLNVPQNTKEGIRWYRKAAAAGSVAARKDLEQLGLTPTEP